MFNLQKKKIGKSKKKIENRKKDNHSQNRKTKVENRNFFQSRRTSQFQFQEGQNMIASAIENFLDRRKVAKHPLETSKCRSFCRDIDMIGIFTTLLSTSSQSKKFSVALTIMFLVCKSFSKIRKTQCILNQEHTTRRTKTARFKVGNCGFIRNSVKVRQKFLFLKRFQSVLADFMWI